MPAASDPPPGSPSFLTPELVGAVAARPLLWRPALVALLRHLPTGWWRGGGLRRAGPWLRFRLETAYGAERTSPTPEDLVTWLRWLRAWGSPPGR